MNLRANVLNVEKHDYAILSEMLGRFILSTDNKCYAKPANRHFSAITRQINTKNIRKRCTSYSD
jgi:hypothetical protein